MSEKISVCVIGAGLAGSECAYQLAKRGVQVTLVEMRPKKFSPAHHLNHAAELVCSNSLRSNDVTNAVGLIKEEMASLDSLIIKSAYKTQVPAGSALAVDREGFSKCVSETIYQHPHIKVVNHIVTHIESLTAGVKVFFESGEFFEFSKVVIATGPLTDEKLAAWILKTTGQESLYFYDSIAPIIEKSSIDMTKAFRGSRYDKDTGDDGDYINCPMTKEEYYHFIEALQNAELAEVKEFDQAKFFEACLPIEEMARRGKETLVFGPMKPVGLSPRDVRSAMRDVSVGVTNAESTDVGATGPNGIPLGPSPLRDIPPYAVVQLRQDNAHETLYNMVGFQTRMKWPEQKRIFKMISGLENAEFVRMGAMHRNTYICSPTVLHQGLEHKNVPHVHFAGQITGCEGYVESAAVGLYLGIYLASLVLKNKKIATPPQTTALGALINHILHGDPQNYQPMNINFGLFPNIELRLKKFDKKIHILKRAFADFRQWYYQLDEV